MARMTRLGELANLQSQIGGDIQRIITNYRKDSAIRKTPTYYEERIRRLEEVWSVFEANDSEMRSLPDVDINNKYFTDDYYTKIKAVFDQYFEYFSSKVDTLTTTENPEGGVEAASSKGYPEKNVSRPASSYKTTQGSPTEDSETSKREVTTRDEEMLIKAIRVQKRNIDVLKRLLDSISEERQPKTYYQYQLRVLNQQWHQVEEYDRKIWELCDHPSDWGYYNESFVELERKTQHWIVSLSSKLEDAPATTCNRAPQLSANNSVPNLPKLTLPKFDGDYAKWQQFYDLFVQLVHCQDMPSCQKMWYLKTNLTGEAEGLLRHFTVSENNYTIAWQTLQDRYNNNRLLVSALVNKLLSQSSHTQPSANNLKAFHDSTKECLLGLQNLNIKVEGWDPILLPILIKKLDRESHMLFEQSLDNPKEVPTIKQLLEFIETRFQSLEALGSKGEYMKKPGLTKTLTSAFSAGHQGTCLLCKYKHPLYYCRVFRNLDPTERLNRVKKFNLCVNCLKSGHSGSNCSARACFKCNQNHHTMLHLQSGSKERPKVRKADITVRSESSSGIRNEGGATATDTNSITLAALDEYKNRRYILLSTAMVRIVTNEGNELECRALLDSGSQVNIITERMINRLKGATQPDKMTIQGIGQGKQKSSRRINVRLLSKVNGFSARLEAFVLPHIVPPQPTQQLNIDTWPIPKNITLADPTFNAPGRIDVLLGAEFYSQLMTIGQINLADNLPTLQNTVFGWIVTGKVEDVSLETTTCSVACTEDEEETSRLIEKFWKLEDICNLESSLTASEKRCEALFNETVKRHETGRFMVALPFAESPSCLGDSKQIAVNRFFAIERRFSKDPNLRIQYTDFMHEYLKLGHMKEINSASIPSPHYFLPHHCVLKPDSSTTKLRVVFDGSSKTATGYSLNDILHVGPTVQSELFSILLRFRLPRFVFTTDIEKMYRQIMIQPDDQKYQLILWRDRPQDNLRCYQLSTVTYGTRSAPYLATKCLQKLAQENNTRYPLGAQVLRNDFYVDDGMAGSNSLVTTKEMQRQLNIILQGAGFKLRKWGANHPALLEGILPEDQEKELDFEKQTEDKIKTLGLTWLPKTDQFRVKVHVNESNRVTKRIVSSDLARLFDPLGIMAPVVVTAKIFSQQLWQLKLHWDEALPMELHTKWIMFRNNLKALDNIQFPRHIFVHEVPRTIQIHAFADASEKAYGAAVYLRSTNANGIVNVRLLCAKSRVAPLQRQTLPRLELCAAVLAVQLVARVKRDLQFEEIATFLWSDSEIVLAWINSKSSSLQTFVANRVAKIQELSLAQQWRHVASKENPADILSRGLNPEKLPTCNLWFYGPLFLHGRDSLWPAPYAKGPVPDDQLQEKIQPSLQTVAVTTQEPEDIIYKINHGNSFKKLQRIMAYMRRFINHARQLNNPRPSQLIITPMELNEALYSIIRIMQVSDFKDDMELLRKYGEVRKGSMISNLSPFLDERGIIRVGGRLQASNLAYDAKHQMLLPYADPLTKLIIRSLHIEHLHCGPQTTLAHVRQQFWPLKGKSLTRSIVQHCVVCAKAKPKLLSQMMGNLPATRVQPARPFINAGVDYCGPIWIHYKIRGKRPQKAYIAIFCCFTTKAVHIEVVSDLSTDAFIGALKRFIGRRGHCKNLYSDNATNFVGARNQLVELKETIYSDKAQTKLSKVCSEKGITFHMIPPRAPHFGGLWEAAVKSAKHLLIKGVSTASLTYEELETVIIEIEAVLNSRPLTPMSEDPADLTALTPGHFLIGEPLTAQVDLQAQPQEANLLKRWKQVSQLKRNFWNRWSREYLNELQYRHKWKEPCQNVTPDTMVLIKDDNLPVMQWRLGRIVETYRGDDNLIRVADVKTSKGIIRRAIHRLAPLPVENEITTLKGAESEPEEREQNPGISQKSSEASTSRTNNLDQPRKRVKVSRGAFITTVLIASMMLPTSFSTPIMVEKFQPHPGIHFESIGAVNLVSKEWTLIIYYDLETYWTELTTFVNGTLALRHLCQQTQQKSTCSQLVNLFEHTEEELKLGNSLFSKRTRRGALNVVGNVANALFGVLDSEYAEKMSRTISATQENEDHLLTLLKNQTSIIDSTVNIIKRDQLSTQKTFTALTDQINQLIDRVTDNGEKTQQIRIFQLLTSLALQMTIISSNLHRIQSAIIDALTDIHHGKFHPSLLSPKQLRQELTRIKEHLPTSMHLPISQDDLMQIYKLMSAEGGISNNHVIFKINIPLIGQDQFDLFRIIPVPTTVNNTLLAINPCASYLAINLHRDQYSPMTENELIACKAIKQSYLCPASHPIYQSGAELCSCEINLFNNSTQGTCELRKEKSSPIWIQLHRPNQWIYAMKTPTRVNTICNRKMMPLTLEGSGLLKLEPNCILKQDLVTITWHHLYLSNISTSYSSFGQLGEIATPETLSPIFKEVNKYNPQIQELMALQELINEQSLMELPKRLEGHTVHQFAVGYLSLILSVTIIAYVIWQRYHHIIHCKKKPVPHPRHHTSPDFTVHV